MFTYKFLTTNTNYYYYNRFMTLWILSRTTQVNQLQKGKTKTNLDFLEQKTVNSSGISWATNININLT